MDKKTSSGGPYCICRSYDDSRFMICCDKCNEWFHGDCVKIKAEEAKKIAHFYCVSCQKNNASFRTIYRSSPTVQANDNEKDGSTTITPSLSKSGTSAFTIGDKRPASPDLPKSTEPLMKRCKSNDESDGLNCGNCIGCFRREDCGRCDGCKKEQPYERFCLLRKCVNTQSPTMKSTIRKDARIVESDQHEAPVDRRKRGAPRSSAKVKNVSSRKETHGRVGRPPKHKANANANASPTPASSGTRAGARAYRNFLKDAGMLANSDDERKMDNTPRQCYGPACIYAARAQSKYCSDECGLKLARVRIQTMLPSRFEQFFAQRPVAEQYEQRRLEKIQADHEIGRARLSELDNEERALNAWRDKCKAMRNDSGKGGKTKSTKNASDESEMNVYCVTCGNESSMKNAIKHFSKCFSKYESQTSYGSSFKALNNLYNIFCDTYNKTNRTYCKRLRVICPEHSKEDKVDGHEICGSPLRPGQTLSTATFDASCMCVVLKKNCVKHYRWMQIRRALIDMERLSQLLRLEELAEETRCIQISQNTRGNVLALLLHHTVSHEDGVSRDERKLGEQVDKNERMVLAGDGEDQNEDRGDGDGEDQNEDRGDGDGYGQNEDRGDGEDQNEDRGDGDGEIKDQNEDRGSNMIKVE